MRIVILLVMLLGISRECFALQRVYYDNATNKTVIDISAQKTREQINKEFGAKDWQEITIEEDIEAPRVINGQLTKYNYIEENKKISGERAKQLKQKETQIKTKLNLSDKELESLKEVLKVNSVTMLELCDYIYYNYPNLKEKFQRWQILSLLDRNEDKIIYLKERGIFKLASLYVMLTDETYQELLEGKLDLRDRQVLSKMLQEKGDNAHALYILTNGFNNIRKGIRILIDREHPKTISWYNPNMSKIMNYKLGGKLCHK